MEIDAGQSERRVDKISHGIERKKHGIESKKHLAQVFVVIEVCMNVLIDLQTPKDDSDAPVHCVHL